jgi:hypothetical protein
VYLNGFGITIDIDATSSVKANLITSVARTTPTATIGGTITASLQLIPINITASTIEGGSTSIPTLFIQKNNVLLNISGNISQSAANNNGMIVYGTNGTYGTVTNIVGNILGNSTSLSSNIFSYTNNASGYDQCNILTINGNISSSAGGIILNAAYTNDIYINGTVIGRLYTSNGTMGFTYLAINGNIIPVSTGLATASISINHQATTNNRTIILGNVISPASASAYNGSSLTNLIDVYGNVTNNGPINAISSPAFRVTGSSLLTIATTSSAGLTSSIFQSGSNFIYPSQNDVRFGQPYGNTSQYSGLMVVPSVNDVRKATLVNTSSATGSVYIPGVDDVRIGLTTNTGSIGTIIIPIASAVSQSVVYDNGTIGTYTVLDNFWSFNTSSFGATGSGKIFQNNLDVKVGSVSSSMMSALNDTSTTNPTVKRLQNLARVQDMGDQVASSSYV